MNKLYEYRLQPALGLHVRATITEEMYCGAKIYCLKVYLGGRFEYWFDTLKEAKSKVRTYSRRSSTRPNVSLMYKKKRA